MLFHITYIDYSGRTQTGRVGVKSDPMKSTAKLRSEAITAASARYGCRRSSIRAVACPTPVSEV